MKLDLARRWTNADVMKWKATRLLPESAQTAAWKKTFRWHPAFHIMKIHLTLLITLCLGFEVQARQMANWSYDMLNDQATLVVIATPMTVTATTERTNVLSNVSVTGVETSFKVLTVLKGDSKIEAFVLHHFALADSKDIIAMNARLHLISFEPYSYKLYLIFLQREADGRYVAVSGQSDPGFSVKQLTENAPPDEFGIPPGAKTF